MKWGNLEITILWNGKDKTIPAIFVFSITQLPAFVRGSTLLINDIINLLK